MDNATMLFKAPGPYEMHGGAYDYVIVDAPDVEAKLAEGWFLTTPEAKQAMEDAKAAASAAATAQAEADAKKTADADATPPTRAELEAKATELEIKFDGRTSDKKLRDLIAATLEA